MASIVGMFSPLRLYKTIMFVLLVALTFFIHRGGELKDSIAQVNNLVSIIMLASALVALAAIVTDHVRIYRISYALTNTALSIWAFVVGAYASFNLASWGTVCIFVYVLVQNYWLLPLFISQREIRAAIDHATVVATKADEGFVERKSAR